MGQEFLIKKKKVNFFIECIKWLWKMLMKSWSCQFWFWWQRRIRLCDGFGFFFWFYGFRLWGCDEDDEEEKRRRWRNEKIIILVDGSLDYVVFVEVEMMNFWKNKKKLKMMKIDEGCMKMKMMKKSKIN